MTHHDSATSTNGALRFAIITDIHLGPEIPYKNVVRVLARHSRRLLAGFVGIMNAEVKPHFVANLGDMINDYSHGDDVANVRTVLTTLEKIAAPVINLVGNHEQWTLSTQEMQSALGVPRLYYSKDIAGFHIVALFSEAPRGSASKIDDEQKDWLIRDLEATSKPTIVFVHHALADQDLTGNWWFEEIPDRALVGNRKEIRQVLEDSGKVIAVFNGHVHWNRMDVHNNIPYFTISSIVEDFRSDGTPSACHAVVEIGAGVITVDIRGVDSVRYEYRFC